MGGTETEKRLVLRYEPGQHTFRHLVPGAGAAQMYALAMDINAFQEAPAARVLVVRVRRFGG